MVLDLAVPWFLNFIENKACTGQCSFDLTESVSPSVVGSMVVKVYMRGLRSLRMSV